MRPSFLQLFHEELTKVKLRLLSLEEEAARMQYVDAPRLQKRYLEALGDLEQETLQEEFDTLFLQKTVQILQTAVNRGEKFSFEEAIAQVEEARAEFREQLTANTAEMPDCFLSDRETAELQHYYHEVLMQAFPTLHPGLTPEEQELYERARQAYRELDLNEVKRICGQLRSESGRKNELAGHDGGNVHFEASAERDPYPFEADYSIAEELVDCFAFPAEIRTYWTSIQDIGNICTEAEDQIRAIKAKFPFTAVEVLKDPEKVMARRAELNERLKASRAENERLEGRLARLREENEHG